MGAPVAPRNYTRDPLDHEDPCPLSSPLILAEARTQVYGRCTHLKGCLAPSLEDRRIEKTNPGWWDLYPDIC